MGMHLIHFLGLKKAKFYDPEIVTADNKNAIETPFLAVFGSIGLLKGA